MSQSLVTNAMLPQELGRGSGMTCCRSLRDWLPKQGMGAPASGVAAPIAAHQHTRLVARCTKRADHGRYAATKRRTSYLHATDSTAP
jgi:hypothetical protein